MKKYYSKTILRMAPYPTYEESGRGLHPYELSKTNNTKVIYLTFFEKGVNYFDVPDNVKLCIGSFYTDSYPRNKGKIVRFFFSLYRLLKITFFSFHGVFLMLKYKVDIVHIHSPMFCLVSFISKIFGKKNIITFHGTDFFRIKNAFWYKFFANFFDLVLSISPGYLKALSELHKCRVIQTYNGIDTGIYKNYNFKRKKQIISVGSLKEAKGIKYLIEGYSLFIKNHPEMNKYNLIIVGKGILYKEFKLMISKLNLEKKIFLVGQKNRDDIIKLYNESEIFILSSLWEGFAKVLVEAMSCGCKVISTNVGSSKLILEDWGYIIDHSDSKKISNVFYKIISNPNYKFYNQEKVLKKFSWNNIRHSYSKIIKNI